MQARTILLLCSLLILTSCALAQPPGGTNGGADGADRQSGAMPVPGLVLPPLLQEALKLTEVQKTQVAELQKQVDAKLDQILTDTQKKQLSQMQQRGPAGASPRRP